MTHSACSSNSGLGLRLLVIIQAQAAALQADDLESFGRLADERDEVVASLDALQPESLTAEDRRFLDEAAATDRLTTLLVQDRLAVLGRELRQLRRGRAALQGYGRPGNELARRRGRLDETR